VHHTPNGAKLYENFVRLAGFTGDWTMGAYREEAVRKIRDQVGDKKVICGLSGGVDSSVAAVLIHEAIGDQLTCVFVDHGLLRKGEAEEVTTIFFATRQLKKQKGGEDISEQDVYDYIVNWKKRWDSQGKRESIASAIRNLVMLNWVNVKVSESLPLEEWDF